MTGGRAGLRTGLALVGLAALVALEAAGFVVTFPTDPLGPRAFPWLAALLLALAGVGVMWRPAVRTTFPARDALVRQAALVAVLGLWALSADGLGFTLSGALALAVVSRLFGASRGQAAVTGVVLAAGLWLLFAWGLGMPFPPPRWLAGGG